MTTLGTYRGFTKTDILRALRPVASNGVAGPASSHLLDVGTDEYLEHLEKEFLQVDDGIIGSTVRIFEGPPGAGKTHLLNLLFRRAVAAGYVTVRTDLSSALHLEDWKFIARHILTRMEASISGTSVQSFPGILSELSRQGTEKVERLKKCKVPHPGFKNASLQAVMQPRTEAPEALQAFLRGERISSGTLAQVGCRHIKDPLSERNAERVLRTVAHTLQVLGFKGLTLMFDENENSLVAHKGKPSKRVSIAANLLRRLIDGCASGDMPNTVVVFTVLPQFLDNAKRALPALGLRTETFRNISSLASARQTMEPGWRFPVQEVERLAFPLNGEEWFTEVVDRYGEILDFFEIPSIQHRGRLRAIITDAARLDAGAGVRRKVQKGCAEYVLRLASEVYWPEQDEDEDDDNV